nr:sugar nucleotide-binding protein [Chromobacterium paludis]
MPAKRPANSRLNCGKLQRNYGITLPAWQQGVDATLTALWQQRQAQQNVKESP